jgi:type II secretory pathway pseudopilin PulG
MKTVACLVLVSCALASPVVSFAQSTAPVTRAQVRAELIRLEQAGYRVGDGDHTNYPEPIQAAEAKIAAQDSQQAGNSDVGGTTTNGTSASGSVQPVSNPSPSSCVGPASYCNLFFGN